MDVGNLDAEGVHKRHTVGMLLLVSGVLGSTGAILWDQHILVRIGIAGALFGLGSLSLFQAQAKT